MKIFLCLDDCRTLQAPEDHQLVVVRSFSAFVNYITIEGIPDIISFDHDLADEHTSDYYSDQNFAVPDGLVELHYSDYQEKTGYDAAKWLVDYVMENEIPIPYCLVHSLNRVGAENIFNYLNNYSVTAERYRCCKYKLYGGEVPY